MICDEARILVSAYQDGELPEDRREEIEKHLDDCPACAEVLRRNLSLSDAIRSGAPTYPASDSLLRSLERFSARRPIWKPFVGGLSAGLAAALAAMFFFGRSTQREFTADLVADHVRSLMAAHLIDVQSSDKHTVKPWFLGKVDFSPNVPDLASDGFPLIGGRLDYVDHHAAAALVYMKARHVINVLVVPERPGPPVADIDGYHVEHWRSGDLDYWAVSDVAGGDLRQFARAFEARSK